VTATAFDNLDDYLALPRVAGLAVSADGSRVVTTVAELNDKRTDYVSAILEVDPSGEEPARRLTRGSNGDSAPAFTVEAICCSCPRGALPRTPMVPTNHRPRCGGYPRAAARLSKC